MVQGFDYIIVGAGSAGCVLANRLSADNSHSVLLIEAGGWDLNPWIHIPLGYGKHFENPKVNWMYSSEPDASTAQRRIFQPRGKVIGGSSSINGLVYIRGQKEDFDTWDPEKKYGWDYDSVLPYFKKSECNYNIRDQYHGTEGELSVSSPVETHLLAESFVESGVNSGYPINKDFNGQTQEGFGHLQMTIKKGIRSSASNAFLRGLRKRRNLTIITHGHVEKIIFQDKVAKGIKLIRKGKEFEYFSNKEIILSAGAFNTPQILQLSGIGPKDVLNSFGIKEVSVLEGVGKNLQDHYNGRIVYKTNLKNTLNDVLTSPIKSIFEGLKYIFFRRGFLNMGSSVAAGFIKSKQSFKRPDLHISLILFSGDKAGSKLHKWSGFSIIIRLLRPKSIGQLNIKSLNPLVQPEIRMNYFSDREDRELLVNAIKTTREIMKSKPISNLITEEYSPGSNIIADNDIENFLSTKGGISYHPVGTCKMGNSKDCVVDYNLNVHGVKKLRIVDASIMPTITSGNTNAPVIMIAEKAADLILNTSKS
jgi:choline dehydrogenase